MMDNMATLNQIIARHPRLYHMAEAGVWDNIRQHGLLSTTALLNLFDVNGPKRTPIESRRRCNDVTICHSEYGRATIRNQIPMPPGMLERALINMTPSAWYRLLNSKVFFWPNESRLEKFLKARSHGDRPHDVLTVRTRSLLGQYANEIRLSRINSGAVRHVSHTRGLHTFQTITAYDGKTRDGLFAELAVRGCVPDIKRHTLSVDRWIGTNRQENIWQWEP